MLSLPMASGSERRGALACTLGPHSSFPSSLIPEGTARRKLPFQPTHSWWKEALAGTKLSQAGFQEELFLLSPWLAHFWMHFIHMPPVMCSSKIGTGSLSEPKQGSLLQVEPEEWQEDMSERESRKRWTALSEQWLLETPQEAAAQQARPVSGSCVPRNEEQCICRAGLYHLSHTHASLFILGMVGVGASGEKRQLTKPATPGLPSNRLFL